MTFRYLQLAMGRKYQAEDLIPLSPTGEQLDPTDIMLWVYKVNEWYIKDGIAYAVIEKR